MKTVSKKQFHERFGPAGIGLDVQYSPPQTLVFTSGPDLWRSWSMPTVIKDLPGWIARILDAARFEDDIYLYPRSGAWSGWNSVQAFQYRALLGQEPNSDEVLVVSARERDLVDSLVFVCLVYGGTVSDDIFLVPASAHLVLYIDHHEAVNVHFRDEVIMQTFVSEFPLEDELA